MNIALNLTPLIVTFVVLDVIAAITVLAVVGTATTSFFRTHRAVRVQRHEAFVPYYRHVALHH